MTLIMNNLTMSISLLAMVISLSMAYLKYKTETIDRENRLKVQMEMKGRMLGSRFHHINGR